MKNPFQDFQSAAGCEREIPLKHILHCKRAVTERILKGYLNLVEAQARDFVWLVEHSHVLKAYTAAVDSIQGLHYDPDDIEDFCDELDHSDQILCSLEGPAGIYVSALINQSHEDRMVLRVKDYQKKFHFLGYRLPRGKVLVVQGDAGDFAGAGLAGGRLVVEGSVANWCGAGMMLGKILVRGTAGWRTGEWMKAGEIQVEGWIRSLGSSILGGRVYEQGKLISSPSASAG